MHNRDLDWRTWMYIIVFAADLFAGLAVATWLQLWVDCCAETGYHTGSSLIQTAQGLVIVTSWIGAGLILKKMNRQTGGSA